jgi:hypothetical protein
VRASSCLLLSVLLAACGDDLTTPEHVPEGIACPPDGPVRLAAAPEYFAPQHDAYYGFHVFGDHVLFSFDRHDAPDRTYWRVDRCGGEPEHYVPLAAGLHNVTAIDTADGKLLYANDDAGEHVILDRLDVPGFDARRPVAGLPGERFRMYTDFARPEYVAFNRFSVKGDGYSAAGVGTDLYSMYTHAGDPDVPALHLGDDIVAWRMVGERLFVHHDDGTIERVVPTTGAREVELTDVRLMGPLGADERRLIWQELGDGVSERVYLRDLDAGTDVEIVVNDFAAVSWQHVPESDAGVVGTWRTTADGDFAALVGPEGTLVAAIDVATGEALAIPEHVGLGPSWGLALDGFILLLPDPEQRVSAVWQPATGDVSVWHRGDARARLTRFDGDHVEYIVNDSHDSNLGTLWRLDLATGDARELLSDVRSAWQFDESHYFVTLDLKMVYDDDFSHYAFYTEDLVIADVDTGELLRLADDVADYRRDGDVLMYLDARGREPGVWVRPLTP